MDNDLDLQTALDRTAQWVARDDHGAESPLVWGVMAGARLHALHALERHACVTAFVTGFEIAADHPAANASPMTLERLQGAARALHARGRHAFIADHYDLSDVAAVEDSVAGGALHCVRARRIAPSSDFAEEVRRHFETGLALRLAAGAPVEADAC